MTQDLAQQVNSLGLTLWTTTSPMSVLAGIRVVEFANWAAVPCAGALFAEMGAEVIKIEPPSGDPMRGMMQQAKLKEPSDIDHPFQFSNRGKKSLALALDTEAGLQIALDLVAQSDIVITNLLPSRRQRLGLTVEAFQHANPTVIVGLLTGFGEDGKDASRPGYDLTSFFASSGLSASIGGLGGGPPRWRSAQGDHVAGLSLFGGVMAALHHRSTTGEGQVVDTSLLRAAAWTNAMDLTRAAADGRTTRAKGREETVNVAVECFQCSDGRWIQLCIPEPVAGFKTVCAALGLEHLLSNPKFDSPVSRFRNQPELVAILDDAFGSLTSEEAMAALDDQRAVYSLAKNPDEVVTDPQARAAGVLRPVHHENGELEVVASPFTIQGTEQNVSAFGDTGTNTEDVLRSVLGKTPEQVNDLINRGAVA